MSSEETASAPDNIEPEISESASTESVEIVVSDEQAGMRLDVLLAGRFPEFSRVHLRRVVDAGGATVDGRTAKVAYRLKPGQVVWFLPPEIPRDGPTPEEIPLSILFEDQHLAVIDKAPGMVVHPSKGHWSGTLTAALAFHFEQLSTAGGPTRPGVVHRLDRDTSGVIIIAKTDTAHLKLAAQFEERTAEKEYAAIVVHSPDRDRDIIDQPIGIHPMQREKMALRRDHSTSRDAKTFFEVTERFDGFAFLRVLPKTGRTHQIRVHLASIGCPVLCDRLYGGRAVLTRGELAHDHSDSTMLLDRQALHARRLRVAHPITGQALEFTAPLPADLEATLAALRTFRPLRALR